MKLIRLSVLLAAISSVSLAQDTRSLEEVQGQEQTEKLLDTLNKLEAQMNTMTKQREVDCTKAVGYAPFCNCIMEDLPVAWTFSDYISITTRTQDENGYSKLDAEHKSAYDKVAPIRDKCVRLINSKP